MRYYQYVYCIIHKWVPEKTDMLMYIGWDVPCSWHPLSTSRQRQRQSDPTCAIFLIMVWLRIWLRISNMMMVGESVMHYDAPRVMRWAWCVEVMHRRWFRRSFRLYQTRPDQRLQSRGPNSRTCVLVSSRTIWRTVNLTCGWSLIMWIALSLLTHSRTAATLEHRKLNVW